MKTRNIRLRLRETFGDPIGSYAGDAPVGVRDEGGECVGCGLPIFRCECPTSGTCPACGMMLLGGECGCSGRLGLNEAIEPCDECGMYEVDGSCECKHMDEGDELGEVAPKGYEKIVKALKKEPSVDNPWAVAWSMRKKGIRPRK